MGMMVDSTPRLVAGLQDEASISISSSFGCALGRDGQVDCFAHWADIESQRIVIPDSVATVITPTSDPAWTSPRCDPFPCIMTGCALGSKGGVWCWGDNTSGRLGDGTHTAHPGTAVRVQAPVAFTSVTMGGLHTCAVDVGGQAWCWGANTSGQLGDGTQMDHALPMRVPGLSSVLRIVGGFDHTCALLANREVQCWGGNWAGESGVEPDVATHVLTPNPIRNLGGVAKLAAGSGFSCAVTISNEMWCWGSNSDGELGVDSQTVQRSATPVRALIPP
jgi:hypothetical protein